MGQKLLKFSQSIFDFLGNRVIAAVLKVSGTTPVHRELFIILRTKGHKEAHHDLNRPNGMGSSKESSCFHF